MTTTTRCDGSSRRADAIPGPTNNATHPDDWQVLCDTCGNLYTVPHYTIDAHGYGRVPEHLAIHHYHTPRNGAVCDYSVPPTPCFDADCPDRPCSCYDPEVSVYTTRHTCGKPNA